MQYNASGSLPAVQAGGENPVSYMVATILDFLQSLLEEGRISLQHDQIGNVRAVGPMVDIFFLKGGK